MCTKEEVKVAVKEVLHETNDDGQTTIGREVNRHIDRRANQIISSLTLRFGIPFIVAVLAGAAAWYTLQNRVEKNEIAIHDGGRYTQKEHDVYSTEVDRRFGELNGDIDEVKADVKLIRQAVVGY